MTKPRLGFIGMGLMGVPMSRRLLAAGYPLTVWNRNPEKTATLAQAGAKVAADIAGLVAHSDILLICVTDTAAVDAVVFAEGGIASAARAGQVVVDFSSIDPAATRDMAARLKEKCAVDWVDAPVSGGVAGAEQGALAIMAGGDEDLIDRLRPVLAPLSQRVTRMGETGAGQVTKICNQMLVSCNVLVMAEVMAMAEKAGVDAARIPQALKGGFADSIPLQLTGPRMAERDFDAVKWHVKTLLKDLDMANDLACTTKSAIPMAGLGAELMRLFAAQGNADRDPCTLVTMYSEKDG
ncbi:MAG: 2-hydroxy-3-oxopropionate reductase [Oceanospirillaceae bacterium]|uniref:NAD(P)-dependent oxidoreductase n=1 Tax=unclassified Thalassolituus TaxID=2624967 RepID=UPI000C5D61A2|nr:MULTISPECIES: NAD(P)-dependent oxidoreductase [unclassified Thalassolituus]MAS24434.1 2-hydroxy-3-oxopropionate reductase [Oceanospirillaceae bacterium]MBL35356.1 2-hydroxy-3-oxopropionate reductase [Oceanospirillaceae bacterium]MBS54847.1 2-hydroxy-3-oxopropionate reductase [Oceanospirillaceae bacterium]|tara:strand:+ start:1095 stop:1979 length:885 start_codon:yes stop_codon:yes gene_type:complete